MLLLVIQKHFIKENVVDITGSRRRLIIGIIAHMHINAAMVLTPPEEVPECVVVKATHPKQKYPKLKQLRKLK